MYQLMVLTMVNKKLQNNQFKIYMNHKKDLVDVVHFENYLDEMHVSTHVAATSEFSWFYQHFPKFSGHWAFQDFQVWV